MNIYAEAGHKVIVTEEAINNGYNCDSEKANKYLKVGGVYTVESTDVSGWHTNVYLSEFPGQNFNSVHFEDYVE